MPSYLPFKVYSQSSLDVCGRKEKLIENMFSTQRQIEYLSEFFRVNFLKFTRIKILLLYFYLKIDGRFCNQNASIVEEAVGVPRSFCPTVQSFSPVF